MCDSIHINKGQNIVFIDTSYYIFYRYFATFNWFKKYSQKDIESESIIENETFMEKFDKLFERDLVGIIKKNKVKWTNVYIVKDCVRETIWRNDYYKSYKGTRDDRLKSFNKDIFKHAYHELLPRLEMTYKFHMVSHDRLEADDIIALMKNEIRRQDENCVIYIITNDNDYIQLLDDKTIIRNLQDKEIKERISLDPKSYLEQKIIVGDKSDNIPCIMRKIGPKTAEKLMKDFDGLQELFEKNPDCKIQYDLNTKLINFDNIPLEFSEPFTQRLNFN